MLRAIAILTTARIAAHVSSRETDEAHYMSWSRFDHRVSITLREIAGAIDVLVTIPEIATDVEHALGALALCLEVTWLAGQVRAELASTGTRPAEDLGAVSRTRATQGWRATG